ncbi:MAG: L-aspartate oxidase [Elusimicrobia bacterium CG1_02_63_36]|nr:MAG: L-aspartate oxidase [Elusimicrobia bacterium CG1_02_63_36]PIP82962.1 MAG: L-aspartate oxidase [Elusimicrobia bacterium CG22_combo_CG10-13_8_21_14_all_63_91]PJA13232.1 MAG: L-aspartate oxidase [Elusimicrobia bacterium CG_4_10_14_0_2_um_filter_63_34]PJB24456.1 MAG: L-aspartate oxidase [Elusimicrobia bacterium CG_4_9_14_3_um_filter_62_55]
MEPRTDFLILGSGIAGLSAALELSKLGTVALVTKKETVSSNTNHAQGGIAAVMSPLDSIESHVEDTLTAGAGLCDEAVARRIVAEGPERIRALIELGVRFSHAGAELSLGLEGGHSQRRVLHAGDLTGREIERALVAAVESDPGVQVFENHVAVDLITESKPRDSGRGRNRCLGAYVLDPGTGKVETFTARATILATGGAGRVYLYTTNPDIATGDGMAMAYRAGAELRNLEFVQFHPTCLYNPAGTEEAGRRFLLSEALRGEGGRLLRADGSRIMQGLHPREDLAPRDIVARAIDADLKRTGAECVYLDMSMRSREFLRDRFPTIFERCARLGLDIAADPIPVVPAAHFFCGGVQTDENGRTTIRGLYAVGEVAHTGLHGANRLASNSLLEGAVVGTRAARAIGAELDALRAEAFAPVSPWNAGNAVPLDEAVLIRQNWEEIRGLMWNFVGIVRSNRRLTVARERLRLIGPEIADCYWRYLLTPDLIELRNIALLAELIVTCALSRRESRGLHFNKDFPELDAQGPHDSAVDRYSSGRASLGTQEADRQ